MDSIIGLFSTSPRRPQLSPPSPGNKTLSPKRGVRSPPRSPYEPLPYSPPLPTTPIDKRSMDARDLSEYVRVHAPESTSPLIATLVLDKQISAHTLINLTEDDLKTVTDGDGRVAEDLHSISLQLRGHQSHKKHRTLDAIVKDLIKAPPVPSTPSPHEDDFDWSASPLLSATTALPDTRTFPVPIPSALALDTRNTTITANATGSTPPMSSLDALHGLTLTSSPSRTRALHVHFAAAQPGAFDASSGSRDVGGAGETSSEAYGEVLKTPAAPTREELRGHVEDGMGDRDDAQQHEVGGRKEEEENPGVEQQAADVQQAAEAEVQQQEPGCAIPEEPVQDGSGAGVATGKVGNEEVNDAEEDEEDGGEEEEEEEDEDDEDEDEDDDDEDGDDDDDDDDADVEDEGEEDDLAQTVQAEDISPTSAAVTEEAPVSAPSQTVPIEDTTTEPPSSTRVDPSEPSVVVGDASTSEAAHSTRVEAPESSVASGSANATATSENANTSVAASSTPSAPDEEPSVSPAPVPQATGSGAPNSPDDDEAKQSPDGTVDVFEAEQPGVPPTPAQDTSETQQNEPISSVDPEDSAEPQASHTLAQDPSLPQESEAGEENGSGHDDALPTPEVIGSGVTPSTGEDGQSPTGVENPVEPVEQPDISHTLAPGTSESQQELLRGNEGGEGGHSDPSPAPGSGSTADVLEPERIIGNAEPTEQPEAPHTPVQGTPESREGEHRENEGGLGSASGSGAPENSSATTNDPGNDPNDLSLQIGRPTSLDDTQHAEPQSNETLPSDTLLNQTAPAETRPETQLDAEEQGETRNREADEEPVDSDFGSGLTTPEMINHPIPHDPMANPVQPAEKNPPPVDSQLVAPESTEPQPAGQQSEQSDPAHPPSTESPPEVEEVTQQSADAPVTGQLEEEPLLIDLNSDVTQLPEGTGEGIREFFRALDGIFFTSSASSEELSPVDFPFGLGDPSDLAGDVSFAFPFPFGGDAEDMSIYSTAGTFETAVSREFDGHPQDSFASLAADVGVLSSSAQLLLERVDMLALSDEPKRSSPLESLSTTSKRDSANASVQFPQTQTPPRSPVRTQSTRSLRQRTERALWAPLEGRNPPLIDTPRMRRHSSVAADESHASSSVPPSTTAAQDDPAEQPPPRRSESRRGRLDSSVTSSCFPSFLKPRSPTPSPSRRSRLKEFSHRLFH
ncbi:hypothetical protein EIP91_001359 [Steccherinum ochraceum]|uniref:Uncharacterized protein n=1 Tax=Steccherinum ochraceum TaxID=92696 RepID=A0A4R0RI03_9APHY|nr:hypothetical protein EIP91_001359 [Steccherinum ochraceum]